MTTISLNIASDINADWIKFTPGGKEEKEEAEKRLPLWQSVFESAKEKYGEKLAESIAFAMIRKSYKDEDGKYWAAREVVEKSPVDGKNHIQREASFISKDASRQIVYGIVYEPNSIDTQKDWASEEEIEKACHNFLKRYRKMGIRHNGKTCDTIVPVESYIAPEDFMLGEQAVKKGSWVLAAHVEDAEVWKEVQEGKLTGFSLLGKGKRKRGSRPKEGV
ncbi:MAG: XkdF-like putative serine protease domain-containing protein [Sphaerochaeta sp.]|jgi:hypothetical protein|nr:XkdF-like putative serine protease domain-containing protein [Sphaerochaeta sp.]